jgi:hypothetical protein
MNDKPEFPGTYFQERIALKTRQVAMRHNDAGLIAMWPEAVREVLAKFPELSAGERASLRGNVEGQIKLLCDRTGKSPHAFTPALQEVARILGPKS